MHDPNRRLGAPKRQNERAHYAHYDGAQNESIFYTEIEKLNIDSKSDTDKVEKENEPKSEIECNNDESENLIINETAFEPKRETQRRKKTEKNGTNGK